MFHPTVYENLKVAFENYIYDLDNREGILSVTHRDDILDLAVMSRSTNLQFALSGYDEPTAGIRLSTSIVELAAEIIEEQADLALCTLAIQFRYEVNDTARCSQVEQLLSSIWEPERPIHQSICFPYEADREHGEDILYTVVAEVTFHRKIGEGQIADIPELVEHMIRTLVEIRDQVYE